MSIIRLGKPGLKLPESLLFARNVADSLPAYRVLDFYDAHFISLEAIAFDSDRAYLTIEARPASGMMGHLVAAEMAPGRLQLVINRERITAVESASALPNKSDEALLLAGGQILTVYDPGFCALSTICSRELKRQSCRAALPFNPNSPTAVL